MKLYSSLLRSSETVDAINGDLLKPKRVILHHFFGNDLRFIDSKSANSNGSTSRVIWFSISDGLIENSAALAHFLVNLYCMVEH